MPLRTNIQPGDTGHIADSDALAAFYNLWEGYAPADFVGEVSACRIVQASKINDVIGVADDVLTVAVVPGVCYDLELFVVYEAATGGDLAFQFTVPGGGSIDYVWDGPGGTGVDRYTVGDVQVADGAGAGSLKVVRIKGNVRPIASGQLAFVWAQSASNAVATILHPGSHLTARAIG